MLVMNDDGKIFRVSIASEASIIPERLKHGRITVSLQAPILFYSKDQEPYYANNLV